MSWRGWSAAKSSSRASVQSFLATSPSIRDRFLGSWISGSLDSPAEIVCPPAAERTLSALPHNYRRVLELRFLRGYSLRETAVEMDNTVGGIKVMQLRALRAAARTGNTV